MGMDRVWGMSFGRKGVIKVAHILGATGLDLLTDAGPPRGQKRGEFESGRAARSTKQLNGLGRRTR